MASPSFRLLRPNPLELSCCLLLLSSPDTQTISRSVCNSGFKLPLSPAWVMAALASLINVFPATPPHPHQPHPGPLQFVLNMAARVARDSERRMCHSCGQHCPGSGLTRSQSCVPAVAHRPHNLPSAPPLQLWSHIPASGPLHVCSFCLQCAPPGFLWRGPHPPSSRVLLKCRLCRKTFLDQVLASPGVH